MPQYQRLRNSVLENPGCRTADQLSRAEQWLTFVLFLIASALMFASLFEWERYQIIAAPRGRTLTFTETVLLFWLITAKSVVWFLPLLPILAVMILSGLRRSATVLLNLAWIIAYYFMAVDLVTVSFMGNHIWDYLPYLQDIINHPKQKFWQWAGDAMTIQALLVLAIFTVSGPVCYVCVRWATVRLVHRFEWLRARKTLVGVTAISVLAVQAILPALAMFHDRNFLDRVFPAMPLTTALRESLQGMTSDLANWLGMPPSRLITASMSAVARPALANDGFVSTTHYSRREAPGSPALALGHSSFHPFRTAGLFSASQSPSTVGLFSEKRRESLLRNALGREEDAFKFRFDWNDPKFGASMDAIDEYDKLTALRYLREAIDPGPVDASAFVRKAQLPNIILIIFESFRHFSVSPDFMSELNSWAEQGLRLQRHYSGSNCSHLGLFSLFYGRAALGFHRTLNRGVPSQMLESLRRSGYHINFLTAGEIQGFRRIHEFINNKSCDNVFMEGDYSLDGMNDWPHSDRRILSRASSIVNEARNKPQFIFFYLLSSHYRYPCPPEFEVFKESSSIWQFFNPKAQIRNHLGRYANSLRFLEHEVMNFIRSIDPTRNIVMITGDHGESMGEDGVFIHASRMSEIQLRVPFIMVGPGIQPRKIPTATVHTDILPTLLHVLDGKTVPIANCQGRDLLADPAPADEVAITRPGWPEWDGLMLVRRYKRMLFKANVAPSNPAPSIEFAGLLDRWGQYELKLDPRDRRPVELTQELSRIAGPSDEAK